MVRTAITLAAAAALAMAASAAALPAATSPTTFSFAQWVEDIISEANTQRELLDQVARIGGFNPLRANTLVDCLDLYSTAGQAEHVVVVVPDDLGLGGVDAKCITEAVDLLRGDRDRASRGEKLPGGHRHVCLP